MLLAQVGVQALLDTDWLKRESLCNRSRITTAGLSFVSDSTTRSLLTCMSVTCLPRRGEIRRRLPPRRPILHPQQSLRSLARL